MAAAEPARAAAQLGQPPIRLNMRGFITGTLQDVRVDEDDELVATVEDQAVRLPLEPELKERLQGLVGQRIIITRVGGEWQAEVLRPRRAM